jgi:hypothetical protein
MASTLATSRRSGCVDPGVTPGPAPALPTVTGVVDQRGESGDEPSAAVEYRLLDLDDGELSAILAGLDEAGVRYAVGAAAIEVHAQDEALADQVLDGLYGPEDELADAVARRVPADAPGPIAGVTDSTGLAHPTDAADPAELTHPRDRADSTDPGGPTDSTGGSVRAGSDFDAALLQVEELAATGGPVYDLDAHDAEALALLVDALDRARVRYALAADGTLVVHRNDERLADAVIDETFGPAAPGTEPERAAESAGGPPRQWRLPMPALVMVAFGVAAFVLAAVALVLVLA